MGGSELRITTIQSPNGALPLWAAVLPLFISLLALVGAPPRFANAITDIDAEFLTTLDQFGITYDSPEAAISGGHQVCSLLIYGWTPNQVTHEVWAKTDLDLFHAGVLVGASIGAYCAQYASEVGT